MPEDATRAATTREAGGERRERPPDISAFLASPRSAAIVTDFDGTLAPIVPDPATSRAIDGAVDVLHRLARHFRTVAVVSGRPVSFLADRLGLLAPHRTVLEEHHLPEDHRLIVSGLYGLEWWEAGTVAVHPAASSWVDVVEQVTARAEAEAPAGVRVERKGLSTTIHVREAPEQAGWAASFTESAAHATGLAIHDARMSYELRPPVEIDKGTVVAELTEGAAAACFLGDDYGDLPAFDALDRLEARDHATVLRVAVRSPEAPAELLSRADHYVDGPAGTLEFLRFLLPG